MKNYRCNTISGPVWPDGCNHATADYVGSFDIITVAPDGEMHRKFDVYLFPSAFGTEVCIRTGEEASQYISPTTPDNLIGIDIPEYHESLRMILARGVDAIRDYRHLDRKVRHGCADAYCSICDGPR